MSDYLSPSEQARLTCTCGHRLARHNEVGCIDCGEPPTGFHAFQRQYHDQWTDAEYPPLTREPGLDGVRAAWLALALGRRSRGGSDEWWEMPATLSEALAIAREYGVIAEEEATKFAALASEDRP